MRDRLCRSHFSDFYYSIEQRSCTFISSTPSLSLRHESNLTRIANSQVSSAPLLVHLSRSKIFLFAVPLLFSIPPLLVFSNIYFFQWKSPQEVIPNKVDSAERGEELLKSHFSKLCPRPPAVNLCPTLVSIVWGCVCFYECFLHNGLPVYFPPPSAPTSVCCRLKWLGDLRYLSSDSPRAQQLFICIFASKTSQLLHWIYFSHPELNFPFFIQYYDLNISFPQLDFL